MTSTSKVEVGPIAKQLMLEIPGRCSDRENLSYAELGRISMTLRELLVLTKTGHKKMSEIIAYCKPNITVVGSVAEMTRGTHIKGHRGIVEATHWRILPAYDLDE